MAVKQRELFAGGNTEAQSNAWKKIKRIIFIDGSKSQTDWRTEINPP